MQYLNICVSSVNILITYHYFQGFKRVKPGLSNFLVTTGCISPHSTTYTCASVCILVPPPPATPHCTVYLGALPHLHHCTTHLRYSHHTTPLNTVNCATPPLEWGRGSQTEREPGDPGFRSSQSNGKEQWPGGCLRALT